MNKNSAISGAFYLTVSSMLSILLGYFLNVWLGRYLGPAGYGIYGVIISLVSIINTTQSAGLPLAISKFISEDEKLARSILKSGYLLQLSSNILIALLIYFFADQIASSFNDLSLTRYIQIAAFVFPAYSLYSLYTGYYNGLHDFKKQSLLYNYFYLFKLILIGGLTYFMGLTGAIIGFAIAPLSCFLLKLDLPRLSSKTFPIGKLFRFSGPLILLAFFTTLMQSIDLYMVKGLMRNSEEVGFYTANQNISKIPFFALSAFSAIIFPMISRSISRDSKERTRLIIEDNLRATLILTAPIVVVISATSMQIVELLFSNRFTPGASSLSILMFGMGFMTLFSVLSNVISGAGNPAIAVVISILSVMVSGLICWWTIPFMGLNGAAFGIVVGGLVSVFLGGVVIYLKIGPFFKFPTLIRVIVASTLIYFMAQRMPTSTIFLPVFYVILGSLYLVLLFMMKEINLSDWRRISSLWKRH